MELGFIARDKSNYKGKKVVPIGIFNFIQPQFYYWP